MDDYTVYNGKRLDLRPKMTEIANGMKDSPEFLGMVSMSRFSQPMDISSIPMTQIFATFLSKRSAQVPEFEQMAFHDPFFIAYSSGTTVS